MTARSLMFSAEPGLASSPPARLLGLLSLGLLSLGLGGCLDTPTGGDGGTCATVGCSGESGDGDGDGDADGGDGDGDGDTGTDGTSGGGATACQGQVDKLDLLFVIDDSQSMREEQHALGTQFPSMVQRFADAGVDDIHFGVVSTDMGLAGIEGIPGCGGLGGDGQLQNTPSPEVDGCDPTYPTFLTFSQGDDPDAFANDLACLGTVGTDGCGFEQPLEAALKAMWPAVDIDPTTGQPWVDPATGEPGNRITFLPDAMGQGGRGHGDGHNLGLLRNDGGSTGDTPSMVAVVMMTDEEDCSSASTRHFTPPQYLSDGDPLKEQSMNLRCFLNGENLYNIDRYVNGLRALRPGNEDHVVFTAIAGVPADAVADPAILDDEGAREAYYAGLLDDPRMIERVDETQPDVAKRSLIPSCQTASGSAFPPRRITEVARRFGPGGMVQSICQEDFSGVASNIVDLIVGRMQAACGS